MPKGKRTKKSDEPFGSSQSEQNNEQSESESRESDDEKMVLTRLRKRTSSQTKSTPPQRVSTRSMKSKIGSPTGNSESLYCWCRKPYDNRFMISCDKCSEWYHGDCVGITLRQGKQMEKQNESYYCLACKELPVDKKPGEITPEVANEDNEDEEDESISLAAIRKQTAAKASDEAQSIDQKSETLESTECATPHSTDLSEVKMEIERMTDFSTLLAAERLMASSETVRASPKLDDQSEENVKNEEKSETPVVIENVAVKKEEEKKPLRRKPRQSVPEAETVKAEAMSSPSAQHNNQTQAPQPTAKRPKDSSVERCFVGGCENRQMPGSIYCSPDCVRAHCTQSIDMLRLVQANLHGKSVDTQPAELRLSVIDAKSGRLINDHKLVNENTIEKFISRHPTFRIVTPQATPSMLAPPPQQPISTSTSSILAAVASAAASPGVINAFRMTVRQELRDALKLRVEGAEDAMFSTTEINRTALRVEEAMYKLLGGSQAEKYKQRFRSLVLNIKDSKNKGLFRRILIGSISPEELATAPAERLASEELVQWREQQRKKSLEMLISGDTKQSVPLESSVPATKAPVTSAPVTTTSQALSTTHTTLTHHDLSTLDESFRIDTTANHRSHLFDVNCKLCTGKSEHVVQPRPPAVPTIPPSRNLPSVYGALAMENYAGAPSVPIQISVPSSSSASGRAPPTDLSQPASSATPQQQLTASTVTSVATPTTSSTSSSVVPVSIMKPIMSYQAKSSTQPTHQKEKSPSPFASPSLSPPRPQLEVEWFGLLKPDALAPSVPISGRLISSTPHVHLENFPETLEVIGKLSTPAVWEYLDKIRRSVNKEIIIVLLEATKVSESVGNYRSTLASLKDRTRYAVVRTVQAQVAGAYKDIYLTYTNTEWLRRLTSYGIKFTEQLPLESKLACILVRYLTAPVNTAPPVQPSTANSVNVIPLENKKTAPGPAQKEAETPRLEETPKNQETDDDDDEDYNPGDLHFLRTKEPEVTPKVTEQPSYIPLVKPVVQQSPILADKKQTTSASETSTTISTTTTTTTATTEKKPSVVTPILSTPEEVSSVSELIRRILGGSALSTPTSTTSTSTSTASITTAVGTSAPLVTGVTATPPQITNTPSGGPVLMPPPVLPPFPPPPPGFAPGFPPFPGPFHHLPPVQTPPIPPGPAPFLGNLPPSTDGVNKPSQPGTIPPPGLITQPSGEPGGKFQTLKQGEDAPFPVPVVPRFPPPPQGLPFPPPPMPLNTPFPPPPIFIPPPGVAGNAPSMQPPPEQFQPQNQNKPFQPQPQQPPRPGSGDLRSINEAERLIWRYLNQLLDESLSLVVRTTLLQELAGLLQNPANEDIVRQSPELTRRFEKAVAIVNSVVERNQPSPSSEMRQQRFGEGPSSYDECHFPRKTLLPTPNMPPLYQAPRQPSPSEEDFVRRTPPPFPGPPNNVRPPNFEPPGFPYRPLHPVPENSVPPPLFQPVFHKKFSDWRLLLRAYRDRGRQGTSNSLTSTNASDSSKSLSAKASWSSESKGSKYEAQEEDQRPSRRSRWEQGDEEDRQQDNRQLSSSFSNNKRGRHESDQNNSNQKRRYSYNNGDEISNKRPRSPRNNKDFRGQRARDREPRRSDSNAEEFRSSESPRHHQQDSGRKRSSVVEDRGEKRSSRWESREAKRGDSGDHDLAVGPSVVPLTITTPARLSPMEEHHPSRNFGGPPEIRFPGLPGYGNPSGYMDQPPPPPPWSVRPPPRQEPPMRGGFRPPFIPPQPPPLVQEPPPFPMFPNDGPRPPLTRGRGGGRGGRGADWGPARGGRGHFPTPRAEFYVPQFGPRY